MSMLFWLPPIVFALAVVLLGIPLVRRAGSFEAGRAAQVLVVLVILALVPVAFFLGIWVSFIADCRLLAMGIETGSDGTFCPPLS